MDYITKPNVMTAENQRNLIFSLKKAYPFLNVGVIGKSLCSRNIYSLSIGRSANPFLIAAGFHGQEWLTCLLALRWAEILLRSKATRTPIWGIDTYNLMREIVIVPCVNPDGVQIAIEGSSAACRYSQMVADLSAASPELWNANARGVDINHNFDAAWDISRRQEIESGILGPSPRRYGGPVPESEPESKAIVNFSKIRKPSMAFALHSQGEEIFWQYGETIPPRSEIIAKILSAASGYRLVDNSGLASNAGFKDWFIRYFNRPAYTVEIGKGKNPLPVSDFEAIFEKTLPMFAVSTVI